MKILPGDSIGRYHILEPLGEGGMAAVYKAYDIRLEREVAIKFLRTELFGPAVLEQLFKRFEREAKALARLSHFHIVKIHDYGEYENTPYLVMEYVPGGTLKSRMGKPILWQEAIGLLLPVARALAYAHQHGVLHRDVKPSNILITESGEPLLSDFGIAKILESGDSQAITTTGVGIGTPEYMAPEQGLAQGVDARTDVYALGIVLYEMLTGQKPYTADTPTAVLIKQIHDPLPNPKACVPDLPDQVAHVLFKALAKQPENRYASMDEFTRVMEQLLKVMPAEKPAAETVIVDWRPKSEAQPETLVGAPPAKVEGEPTVAAPGKPALEQAAVQPAVPAAGAPAAEGPKIRWKKGWIAVPVLAVAAVAVGLAIWLGGPMRGARATAVPTSPPVSPVPTRAPVSPVPTKAPMTTPLSVAQEPLLGEILKIGVILPMSGSQAVYGSMAEKGVVLAIDQWNERGGVLGLRILPLIADGRCSADPTLNEGSRLLDDENVKFIIGEICSRPSIPLAEMTSPRGVIQISPAATNPQLTVDEHGVTRPFTFRACLVDPFQGLVAARFAYDTLGARRVFAVYEQDNPYGQDLAEAFMRQSQNWGAEYAEGISYPAGTKDFLDILKKIDFVKPDVIYLPALVDVVNSFVRQARDHGITAKFVGADGWDSPALDLQVTAGSFYTTHYWMDDPRAEITVFRDAFGARFQGEQGNPLKPDVFAALAYDSTNLLLQAITDAGSVETEAVRASLERIEFAGVTGPIRFDEQHNPVKPAVILAVTPEGLRFESQVMP